MILQICAAMAGTVSFSLLFGVPRKFYPWCGLIGGAGWAVYVLFSNVWEAAAASFAATVAVIFLSRAAAVKNRCPAMIFLISGIFPLVPGAGIYWTVYYLVTNQLSWLFTRDMRR
ncbi:threonine/serine exporter family protein [Clostridium sp. AM58-1XD]|uniref:threonine/serine exporter family protein n=1 Tax=Clostridium sp. AM58-1XD TaxID=2292307 RepID=UPI0026828F3C